MICYSAIKNKNIKTIQECIKTIPEDNTKEISKYKAIIEHKNGNYELSEGYYLDFLDQKNNIEEEIIFSNYLAEIYVIKSDFYQAINYISNAASLNSKLKYFNKEKYINKIKIKIGILNIFLHLGVKDKLKEDYKKITDSLKKINSKESINILLKIYYILSFLEAKDNNIDYSIDYAKKIEKISKTSNYKLGIAYGNMATVNALIIDDNFIDIKYLRKLIKETEDIFINLSIKEDIVFDLDMLNIKIDIKEGNYLKAKSELFKKYSYLDNKIGNKNKIKILYSILHNIYIKEEDSHNAMKYKWKEIEITKSIRKKTRH